MPTNSESTWEPSTGVLQIVERFEQAWMGGKPPRMEDYLPTDAGDRPRVLLALVLVDLERRFQAGEAVRAEAYLQRFPELAGDAAGVFRLITAEHQQRRRRDAGLTHKEYVQRFPEHAKELRGHLQAAAAGHQTIRAGAAPTQIKPVQAAPRSDILASPPGGDGEQTQPPGAQAAARPS